MCHGGKCCLCIPAERACLVLAIIKAVISGIILLASVIMACLCVDFSIVGPMALGSVIAFSFTVVLCNGICTRQAGQLKVYFVYGVVSVAAEAVASVFGFSHNYYHIVGILGLIGCALHSLFVLLVHHTYIQMTEVKPSPLVMI